MATNAPKRRRLNSSRGNGDQEVSDSQIKKSFIKNAASWNLEQDYENRPRRDKKRKKEGNRLPIKLADGHVEHMDVKEDDEVSVASGDWLDRSDDEPDEEPEPGFKKKEEEEEIMIPEAEQIRAAQEELAKIATGLNENPEEHAGSFKALAKIGASKLESVKKLTIVTQMAVYKDVIPGYRIRQTEEETPGELLSKDVRRLRAYEQSMVSGYQTYIKTLASYVRADSRSQRRGKSLSSVATTCACTLLTSVPHFNFRGELIKILVRRLSRRKVDEDFLKCIETLETLFREDEDGNSSFEAVSILTKMMKTREYQVDESLVNLFLHLRLLSEFSGKASQDHVEHENDKPAVKKPKSKREFRTKKERKAIKEQKAIDKVMAHTDALVSYEERDRMQSETLKLVFATYFRILKMRQPHLMGAVLEGLAKYAHLINQDFFGDLLEALKDLIRHSEEDEEAEEETEDGDEDPDSVRNTSREALLCNVTAFALLAGQDAHNARSDLHLDLSFFTTHLFKSLFELSVNPDLERTASSVIPESSQRAVAHSRSKKVNLQTTTVLLIRCLTAILLPAYNIRSVPPLRLAAFTKQLLTFSLQVPEKSCRAILALLTDVADTHGRKIAALWNTEERRGDGTYDPVSNTVEGSNPFTTTAWEGEILRLHYAPAVREGSKMLEKMIANQK